MGINFFGGNMEEFLREELPKKRVKDFMEEGTMQGKHSNVVANLPTNVLEL